MAKTATKLNGIWLLEIYEKDNLKELQVEDGNQVVYKTYIKDELQKVKKKEGWNVIEFTFRKNGKGVFQEYNNYKINSDFQEIESCQPIPELKWRNGKISIYMTYMFGEGIEDIIELTKEKLIIENQDGIKRKYKRIK
ncbi:hypothetical protein [Xanthovirga aplysinae]|uniref:hypothetical protein n=1 Tax=Xanthovirga aplysinae TaxID=2529853 RepID=UPI0012BC3196|nr:hypothetical protein [Xanthovirga aplysinae]MTI29654.1 hypothetical protein [Xanthovirga aplysinae]